MEDNSNSILPNPVERRATIAKQIGIFGIALSLLFSLIAIVSISSNTSEDSAYSSEELFADESFAEEAIDLYWAPAGFTVWSSDPNVAYKWAAKNNCDQYGCISAEFISKMGCPNSFYAALNWLDSNDSVISYDNASLPSLGVMQIAKLRFDDIEGSSTTGQMAEINCR